MTAIDKIRTALEKARRLQYEHRRDGDDGVAMFLDEAMSWLPELEREMGRQVRVKLETEEARLNEKLAW